MTCFNIEGTTMRKYCIKNNIKYQRVYHWLEKGYSVEESVKKAKEKILYPQTKWLNGNITIHQFCKKNDIGYNSVVRAIKKGLSIDRAIEKTKSLKFIHGRPPKYEFNGKKLHKFCKENGLSYMKVWRLIVKGVDSKEAVERVKNV